MGDFGKDITSIAVLLIGVAMMALLVGHAAGTTSIITAATQGFDTLLGTVELTGTASNGPNSGSSGGISAMVSPLAGSGFAAYGA